MSNHAACSPSSAAMWLACPASVTKTRDVVRPSSKYAREGTAAHKVAEMILSGDIFLPDKIEVEGEQFIVSPGMCRALRPYIDTVQGLANLGGSVWIEKRVAVPDTFNRVWGTLDCGVILQSGDLHVVDLKYGKGVAVDPEGPQLKLYALGLMGLRVKPKGCLVTLTVCQPRVGDGLPHSVTLVSEELLMWKSMVVTPAVERIVAGDETEVAGPHCRWCVRREECAAFAAKHQSRASDVFDDVGA